RFFRVREPRRGGKSEEENFQFSPLNFARWFVRCQERQSVLKAFRGQTKTSDKMGLSSRYHRNPRPFFL
uniref:Uncharacterized protein n=1 Tax=Anopheles albimanus TaxID=7167 RepID=A0A182FZ42_ANOAL